MPDYSGLVTPFDRAVDKAIADENAAYLRHKAAIPTFPKCDRCGARIEQTPSGIVFAWFNDHTPVIHRCGFRHVRFGQLELGQTHPVGRLIEADGSSGPTVIVRPLMMDHASSPVWNVIAGGSFSGRVYATDEPVRKYVAITPTGTMIGRHITLLGAAEMVVLDGPPADATMKCSRCGESHTFGQLELNGGWCGSCGGPDV